MKKHYIISNIVIICMLVCLCTLSLTYTSTKSVFANNKDKPIYKGNPLNNNVSLMINVYWGEEFLGKMLDTLDQYNIKTTFFLGGSWVDDNNKLVIRIKESGHEIASHGYFHKDHSKLNAAKNKEEIVMSEQIIEKICGVKPNLFAPPSGAFNDTTLDVCKQLNYKVIMWTKDTIDWRDKNTDLIFKRATTNVSNGDLILMHPTACTAEALPKILDYYKAHNLIATTVSNTIS